MNKTLSNKILAGAVVAALLVVVTLFALSLKQEKVLGNVRVGDQLKSTTTPTVADRTNLCPARSGMASSTTGMLGSVLITGYGAGELMLIDATTSDATLRNNIATSSLILAHFPITGTSSPAFNIGFSYGLFVDYTSGVGTSTITYRCEG